MRVFLHTFPRPLLWSDKDTDRSPFSDGSEPDKGPERFARSVDEVIDRFLSEPEFGVGITPILVSTYRWYHYTACEIDELVRFWSEFSLGEGAFVGMQEAPVPYVVTSGEPVVQSDESRWSVSRKVSIQRRPVAQVAILPNRTRMERLMAIDGIVRFQDEPKLAVNPFGGSLPYRWRGAANRYLMHWVLLLDRVNPDRSVWVTLDRVSPFEFGSGWNSDTTHYTTPEVLLSWSWFYRDYLTVLPLFLGLTDLTTSEVDYLRRVWFEPAIFRTNKPSTRRMMSALLARLLISHPSELIADQLGKFCNEYMPLPQTHNGWAWHVWGITRYTRASMEVWRHRKVVEQMMRYSDSRQGVLHRAMDARERRGSRFRSRKRGIPQSEPAPVRNT